MADKLIVRLDDGETVKLTANRWHVDDRGQLHANKGDDPVASFARDRWTAIEVVDAPPGVSMRLEVEGLSAEAAEELREAVLVRLPAGARMA